MTTQHRRMERNADLRETAKEVYEFIGGYITERGFSPSMDDIAAACYLSRSSVLRYLDKLEAWGLISREPGIPRSLRVFEDERGKLNGL